MEQSKKKQDEQRVEKEWETVDAAVKKSGNFILNNQKPLLIAFCAFAAVVCLYLAVKQFYIKPRNQKAQAELFKGEEYFRAQQDSMVINGDGKGFEGMVAFIDEYGSTKAANVAKAYAGISYARLGKYDKALEYLKKFNGGDAMISYAVEGAIGDCYANQDKVEEAASQFMKAAKGADNALESPIFYKKAAIAYRQLKDYAKVIEVFTTIKNEYASSPEAAEADKYIAEAELLKK